MEPLRLRGRPLGGGNRGSGPVLTRPRVAVCPLGYGGSPSGVPATPAVVRPHHDSTATPPRPYRDPTTTLPDRERTTPNPTRVNEITRRFSNVGSLWISLPVPFCRSAMRSVSPLTGRRSRSHHPRRSVVPCGSPVVRVGLDVGGFLQWYGCERVANHVPPVVSVVNVS